MNTDTVTTLATQERTAAVKVGFDFRHVSP